MLLILAGISIKAITGDNGIIKQAQNAKSDTEYQQWSEKIDTAIIDAENKHRNPSIDDIIEELKSKEIIAEDSQVNLENGAITTNEPSYVIEDKLNDYLPNIPDGLEIGTVVHYKPNGTYEWKREYYSSTGNSEDYKTLDSSSSDYKIEMWRVLDIDRKTGEISLVPVKPTTGTVYLGEAQGYNNAVYLLNEACKNLYGDNEKGITARSINIEDI